MNCEWKNILINSLKVNLQEDKITNRISSFKLPVSSIQQDGRPDVRILPFAGFIQFKCCPDGKLENQNEDQPKHMEIPFLTVDDMFLPAKDKLLNSLLFKVDTRSDFLTNIYKGSKFTEVCWFFPYTKEEFRLCGSFHTIISPTTTGKNYAPIGKPFCNTNSYNINWELLRKMVWDQMPEKEKKTYLNFNDKYTSNKMGDPYNREYKENTYDFNYNVNYQYSTTTSPGHSRRNSISRKKSNLSVSRKSSIKHNSSSKSPNNSVVKNNNEIQNNNDDYQEKELEPKPSILETNINNQSNKNENIDIDKKEIQVDDKNHKKENKYVEKDDKEKDDDNNDDYHYTSSSTKHSIYIEKTNITKYDRHNNKVDQQTEINIHRNKSKIKKIVKSEDENEHRDNNLNDDNNKMVNTNSINSSPHDSMNFTSPIQDEVTLSREDIKNINNINRHLQSQYNKEDHSIGKISTINNKVANYLDNSDDDSLFEVEPYLMDLYFQDDHLHHLHPNEHLENEKHIDNTMMQQSQNNNDKKNNHKDIKDYSKQDQKDDNKKDSHKEIKDHSEQLIINNINDKNNKIKESKLILDDYQNKMTINNTNNNHSTNNDNDNHGLNINKKINYHYSSSYSNKTTLVRHPSSKSKSKTLSSDDDAIQSSLDRNPSTFNDTNVSNNNKNDELKDNDTRSDKDSNEKQVDEKLSLDDIEKAYNNFCLLIVDIESIDYVELTYFPRKKTTFYKIECPYFSTEDEKSLHNKKENYFYRNNNKFDEKHLHKHYDNFNSIYPSMSTKQDNMGYEPFTGNQIQNTSYIFDNDEPMSKISKNQTIYKKVYWIKKKI